MAQLAAREVSTAAQTASGPIVRAPEKPIKIIAKSLYRELRSNGYDDRQIVALSAELIELLTEDIKVDAR